MGDHIKLYTLIGHAMCDVCTHTNLYSFKINVDISIPSNVYHFLVMKTFKIPFVVFSNAHSTVLFIVTTS